MTFGADHVLRLAYHAQTDADTVLSLTNHSFFNLRGKGEVYDHILTIDADSYTPVNENLIPTGEVETVLGTPLDFSKPHRIGERIEEPFGQLQLCGGYDHNFVLRGSGFRKAARVCDPVSGREMEVWTDKPGVQLYTANFMEDVKGKNGAVYGPRSAYCFETQLYPDSMHHDNFPSCVLEKGKIYEDVTEYRFLLK